MEPIILNGQVEHGQGRGRGAGFPTANLHVPLADLPDYGVYSSLLYTADGLLLRGVTNVGTRPTADLSDVPTVETWIPGWKGDLYGRNVCVVLLSYLRGIRAFADMEALKRQIDLDAERAAGIAGEFLKNGAVTRDKAETRAFGSSLAARLECGDVLTLSGPLGAGKSELARGIGRGLGIAEVMPSPTFTILNAYSSGRLSLYHYDWYRIEDPEELTVIGAEEHLPGDGVTLIEWAERAPELLPESLLKVMLLPLSENVRLIILSACGGFRAIDRWITEIKKDAGLPD